MGKKRKTLTFSNLFLRSGQKAKKLYQSLILTYEDPKQMLTSETGLLYNPARPEALTTALQQAQQRSWSESVIMDYARQFDWDRPGPHLVDFYKV